MSLITGLLFVAGLVLLIGGAEALVRGASGLAARLGISPLIIGLTVVAFGTSSPELAVSILAALRGQADLTIGNVVGSNLFNLLLILGLTAAILPLAVDRQLLRLDVPVMILSFLLLPLLALDGEIGRGEGLLLVAGLLIYTGALILLARKKSTAAASPGQAPASPGGNLLVQLVLVAGGLAALVLGSDWLVDGAVELARFLGLSELVIGLTVIAAGTSLPEVASSVVAALRGERDIAVGNVVGSCTFNILSVLGISAAVTPGSLPVAADALALDIPAMIGVGVLCLPIFYSGYLVSRAEGFLLLGAYVVYTLYLVLDAQDSSWLSSLQTGLLWGGIPLTVLVVGGSTWRAWRRQRQGSI
ncbi:MAG: calcium/sodium antiporter [Myxococcota bacterium]|jgi:cation:H+ antiporter|nr:calcium/sodium antiporter [Myxococcota bacterium]